MLINSVYLHLCKGLKILHNFLKSQCILVRNWYYYIYKYWYYLFVKGIQSFLSGSRSKKTTFEKCFSLISEITLKAMLYLEK